MLNRFASLGLPLLVLALLAGCQSNESRTPAPAGGSFQGARAVRIINQVHGNAGELAEPTLTLIQEQSALEALGVEDLNALEVDFNEHDVILLALGEQPTGGYWAHITGVHQVDDVLYVEGQANRPGEDQAATQALTYPYAAVVIRKTGAATALSDIESVRGQSRPE